MCLKQNFLRSIFLKIESLLFRMLSAKLSNGSLQVMHGNSLQPRTSKK
uniref:Uncharacterized protein n=1 Tax=Rhizobium phage IG49 TaxID=3129228 RepID=A0AAU8HZ23_9CAUD